MFTKCKMIKCKHPDVTNVATLLAGVFRERRFDVAVSNLVSGGSDVSISKGHVFKSVLGLRTSLRVELRQTDEGVFYRSSVGIFGQQVIPSILSVFVAWPIVISQTWGVIQQLKLDNHALAVVEGIVATRAYRKAFCTNCGSALGYDAQVCNCCGHKQKVCDDE